MDGAWPYSDPCSLPRSRELLPRLLRPKLLEREDRVRYSPQEAFWSAVRIVSMRASVLALICF